MSAKKVCSSCMSDVHLRAFVVESGERTCCDYCGKTTEPTVSIGDLFDHLMPHVWSEYDRPEGVLPLDDESASGFFFEELMLDVHDVFYDLGISEQESLVDDLATLLSDETNYLVKRHGVAPSGVEQLTHIWKEVQVSVRSKSRYGLVPLSDPWGEPLEMLEALGKLASAVVVARAFKVLAPGQSLFRVRFLSAGGPPNSPREMGPPPPKVARQSRMSAAGVPAFYLATSPQVAIAETYDKSKPHSTGYLAEFETVQQLRLIDLASVERIPLFGSLDADARDRTEFLLQFAKDISRPIPRDDRIHIDYAPTQLVTEYIRWHLTVEGGRKCDGVIYPSSHHNEGVNVVLFCDLIQDEGVVSDKWMENLRCKAIMKLAREAVREAVR